jgi:hypothetical protein
VGYVSRECVWAAMEWFIISHQSSVLGDGWPSIRNVWVEFDESEFKFEKNSETGL